MSEENHDEEMPKAESEDFSVAADGDTFKWTDEYENPLLVVIAAREGNEIEDGDEYTARMDFMFPDCPKPLATTANLPKEIREALQEYYPDYHLGPQYLDDNGAQKDLDTIPEPPTQENSDGTFSTNDLEAALPTQTAPIKVEELPGEDTAYADKSQS